MSEKPLTPWVICERDGKILCGHCDCMAGLGESCSHVASLLWAIEAGVKKRDSLTVTDKKAYWVLPSAVKKVPYSRVRDICFNKNGGSKSPTTNSRPKPPPAPTQTELSTFYSALKSTKSNPVILSLLCEYSDSFIPKSLHPDLPLVLSEIYDKKLEDSSYTELTTLAAEKISIYGVHPQQQRAVEEKTRQDNKLIQCCGLE